MTNAITIFQNGWNRFYDFVDTCSEITSSWFSYLRITKEVPDPKLIRKLAELRDEIIKARPLNYENPAIQTAMTMDGFLPLHRIFNSLFLGSISAIDHLRHNARISLENLKREFRQPYQKTLDILPIKATIYSLCPKKIPNPWRGSYGTSRTKKPNNKFPVKHLGKLVKDIEEDYKNDFDLNVFWGCILTYACTFFEDKNFNAFCKKEQELVAKKRVAFMKKTPVKQWFSPIFKDMHAAVLGDKNVVITCQMGVSRSTTAIAAYLIRYCGVSAEQAVLFLQSQRKCVDPKFMLFLNRYEALIRSVEPISLAQQEEKRIYPKLRSIVKESLDLSIC